MAPPSPVAELFAAELDALQALAELRRATAWQLAALAELVRWAGDLTDALNRSLPRRYGVTIAPPRFPEVTP